MGFKSGALEDLVKKMFNGTYKNKRVLVTGHTGFKGTWLCSWLDRLGAEVYGLALEPPTIPSIFAETKLKDRMNDFRIDIREREAVMSRVKMIQPDFVFHLAAQPLVREGYHTPVETFSTNVMGTVYLLEAIRLLDNPCAIVIVTSDKCYRNNEWLYGYRENDPLGGHDPYSASKACAEMVSSSYHNSFFRDKLHLGMATVRAGNVIGGGDWAADRIVPDCIRALQSGEPIRVRNPHATRPWQHVLDPLSGYLHLGMRLWNEVIGKRVKYSIRGEAFNFGPPLDSNRKVGDLVSEILKHWPGKWIDDSEPDAPHEADLLQLSVDKAYHVLGWQGIWPFEIAVKKTVIWYRQRIDSINDASSKRAIDDLISNDIHEFETWKQN